MLSIDVILESQIKFNKSIHCLYKMIYYTFIHSGLGSNQSFISQRFEEENFYNNHNMNDNNDGRYRRPGRMQYPSASAQSVADDEEVPESLPSPMARG